MRIFAAIFLILCGPAWGAIGRPAFTPSYPTANAPVVIRIVSPVVVKNDSIQLGEISEIQSTSTKELEDLKGIQIAVIPSDQEKLEIPSQYIETRVRESLGMNRLVEFQIPRLVEFQRQFRLYTKMRLEEEVSKIVAEELGSKPDEAVRVELENFEGLIDCPQGSQIQVKPLAKQHYSPGKNQISIRFIKDGTEVKPALHLEMNLQIQSKRWVSVRDLGILEKLHPDDFELREVALAEKMQGQAVIASDTELAKILDGAKVRKFMKKGTVLADAYVLRTADVERGQKIKVIINNNGIRLVTKGEVLKSGFVGSELRVRLEKSGRIVSGELKDKDSVEIQL